MKHIPYIISFSFLLFLNQGCSKKSNVQPFEAGQTIPVLFDPDRLSLLDSFIDSITIIPLETNDNCLFRQAIMQVKEHNGLIYFNNFTQQLLVFDAEGNFIREIGSRGQGPGEFLDMRDFIFTSDETIEILDYRKIERYTLDGKYIETVKRFDFIGKDFYCNPVSFCRSFSNGYYLWGGMSYGGNEKLRGSGYLMYRMNEDMKVEEGFFEKKYGDGGTIDRFKYYQDKILITPSPFNYNIYQIDPDDSIRIRYTFDFGKYGYKIGEDFDISNIAYENYITGITDFHETDHFFYFNFSYQKYGYSLLYSKATGQTFINSLRPASNGKELRLFLVKAIYNDRLIALLEPSSLKFELNRMSPENIKKWGLEAYKNINDEDNPVLMIYKTKF